jgi:hypothetical protein
VFGFALFAAWVILLLKFFFLVQEYMSWACPRCGKRFHGHETWLRWNKPLILATETARAAASGLQNPFDAATHINLHL